VACELPAPAGDTREPLAGLLLAEAEWEAVVATTPPVAARAAAVAAPMSALRRRPTRWTAAGRDDGGEACEDDWWTGGPEGIGRPPVRSADGEVLFSMR
jgi:hypothetical protein